jgi:hypothetical protein
MREMAEKEKERTDFAFRELALLDKRGEDLLRLAKSYKKDADTFFKEKKWLEAFELYVYLFGILDSLARLGMIDPGKARKHYKVDQ